ncbi:hypothetical protein GCM10009854_38440 [Saccharopolyspora halophila]|uniref:Uncharacterized protein n=1 Tax=Saccharopolyspora halophila TaxID=405551 RepID=A0ABN3GND8_9PSEU
MLTAISTSIGVTAKRSKLLMNAAVDSTAGGLVGMGGSLVRDAHNVRLSNDFRGGEVDHLLVTTGGGAESQQS